MVFTVLAVLVLPSVAAAKTWVVGVSGNIAPDVGCEASPDECDLWEAINLANSTVGKDTIEFTVTEVEVTGALPNITEAVTIDGSDPAGDPGVEIWMDTEGFFDGIRVTGSGSTIEGLAVGGFSDGIALVGNENKACGNYLGTGLDGTTPEANRVGIEVAVESEGNKIGASCPAGDGNLISGNGWFGVIDNGAGTEIRRNLIGLDVDGKALANGYNPAPSEPGGGIYFWGEGGKIGGIGAGQGNTIASNDALGFGAGIYVRAGAVSIRGNSIFANQGAGIEYFNGPPTAAPEIEAVKSTETVSSVVTGSVIGGALETLELDFFANAACDAGGEGEGETYLGSATAKTDGTGAAKFEASLPVQPKGTVLTATATRALAGVSSEFSTCFSAPQPGPAPPKPPTPPTPDTPIAKFVPSNGESVAVAPKEGTVLVQRPGQKKPTPLKEGQTIPVGSIVDATKGKVTLTSINAAGEEQTADFYGGKFVVLQHDGSGLVILKLRGGNFSSCKGAKGSSAGATASGKSGRRLWGSGKGNFRTEGNHGSATVRGTIWFTEDRCTSTFFKVKRGVVSIRDFDAGKTFSLPAGKSYLAKP